MKKSARSKVREDEPPGKKASRIKIICQKQNY